MANAGERAIAASSQLQKVGFVDFTVDLVKGVYEVILNGSMEQLKAYAEFVSKVANTLEEYQAEVIGASTKEELSARADSYIKEVFQLDPTSSPYTLNEDQINSMKQQFTGVTITAEDNSEKSFEKYLETDGEDGATSKITIENLRAFVIAKLKSTAKESYELIKTILKIGMQKVVVTNGEISTRLTFHVDTHDTYNKTADDYSTKSSGWGLGGSISGRYGSGLVSNVLGNFIGGSLSGGYRNSKLNVSVANEKTTSADNVTYDILGNVKIQFKTETFPSVDA